MLKKLRVKFICINMTIVTLMLGVIFSILYIMTAGSLEQESIRMMREIAARPMEMKRHDSQNVHLPYFMIQLGSNGEILHQDSVYFDLSDDEFLNDVLSMANSSQSGTLPKYNLRFLRTATPMGQCIVFSDMTNEKSILKNLVKICIFIDIAALSAFLGISIILARWAVRPVASAWHKQKQFIADASHELKTPLTVIMTNAELLNSPECTKAERKRFSSNILTMTGQMRGLVESLLEIAQIDSKNAKSELHPVNFSEIVSNSVMSFEPLFFEQNMTLLSKIEPDITINGNAEHLKRIADIFLDNAQKYTSPGKDTTLTLRRTGHNRCLLKVANPGEPISPEDLTNIFRRFYRIDKARSMNHSYGLGLSIAQSIVIEHGGRIWAESKNGYNIFCAELPAMPVGSGDPS